MLQSQVLEAFRKGGISHDALTGVEARERVSLDKGGRATNRIRLHAFLGPRCTPRVRRHFSAEHNQQKANW
jgi:hypothetical protein